MEHASVAKARLHFLAIPLNEFVEKIKAFDTVNSYLLSMAVGVKI